MADDFYSKVVIEDGFSEPLDTLGTKSEEAGEKVDGLNDSLEENAEQCEEVEQKTSKLGKCLERMQGAYAKISEKVVEYGEKLSSLHSQITDTSQAQNNMMKMFFVGNMGGGIFGKFFDNMSETIEKNMDSIELADKLEAVFGDAADAAREASYDLAMELGQDSKEVSRMAAQAAQQGIGTEHFERIMRLADRVGTLNVGETTTGVADQLIQNIKSGHDAGTIANMYGGGEKMERQLRAAGYERALNHGDMDKALDIAEKIAKQAGYTDEAYSNASDSLSKNWKKIGVFIENLRDKIATMYSRALAPIVKKISDFIASPEFKRVQKIVEGIANVVMTKLSQGVQFIMDNIETIFKLQMVAMAWKLLTPFRLMHKAMGGTTASFLLIIGIGVALFKLLDHIMKELGVCQSTAGLVAGTFVFWKNVAGNIITTIQNLWHKIAGLYHQIETWQYGMARSIREGIVSVIMFFIEKVRWAIKESGLQSVFEFLGLDMDNMFNKAEKKLKNFAERGIRDPTNKAMEQVQHRMDALRHKFAHQKTKDAMEGVDAAYQIKDWGELGDKVGGIFEEIANIGQKVGGIQSDTGAIRKYNEQEEDLKWLKLFSDRQTMSSYNSMTSNVRNVTFNGMSQAGMSEMGRRNLSTMPSRALL